MIVVEDLTGLELFAGVESGLIGHVAHNAADVHLSPGEYAIHEGEVPSFFVILSGKFELTKRFGASERSVLERQAGDYFGEVPLLLGSTTFAGLRALEPGRLARFDAVDFGVLVRESPTFEARVRRTLTERVDGMQQWAAAMPGNTVTLIGHRVDAACHNLRDFLSRNHMPYDFLESDESCVLERFPHIEEKLSRTPIVVLGDEKMLLNPTMREVAFHLQLQVEPASADYDVTIIGGGPAGLAAAVYGASEGLRTLMIEREAPGGQAGTSSRIENYLGFPAGIGGDELGHRALEQAKRLGAEIVVTRQVTTVYVGDDCHEILLDGGDVVKTHAIVLATGVRWRMLPIEGIDRFLGAGVYFGAARTEAANAQGQDVYLIGAGNSAGQAAMFFSNYARTVTLVVRGKSLEASMSDYLIRQLHSKDNIRVELSSEVTAVYGEARLEAIDVTDRKSGQTRRCPTDAIFVFIGAEAETGWLPSEIARDERGYILTGTTVPRGDGAVWKRERDPFLLETSVPGIFAAGDVRANSVKRVAAGVGEGSMAIAFIHQYLAETREAADSKLAGSR